MGFKMDSTDPTLPPPGIYLVEVKSVREGTSKKSGDPYWKVALKGVDFDNVTPDDIYMLAGRGASMTKGRLKALGFDKGADVEPTDLIGRRVYVAVMHGQFNGQPQLQVDSRYPGSSLGYWPEAEPPAELESQEAQATNLFGEADPSEPDDPAKAPF